ncbi:MAG: hypothetical protein WD009_13565 [Phycisphaeraceae bacterium]
MSEQGKNPGGAPAGGGDPAASAGRPRWAVTLAVGCAVLLFASGAVTGWSLSSLSVEPVVEAADPELGRGVPPRLIERAHERLAEDLRLDDTQTERLRLTLQERAGRLHEIHERIRPELQEEWRRLEGEIRGLLDDEQRERWEKILEQRRSVFSSPRGRRRDRE